MSILIDDILGGELEQPDSYDDNGGKKSPEPDTSETASVPNSPPSSSNDSAPHFGPYGVFGRGGSKWRRTKRGTRWRYRSGNIL